LAIELINAMPQAAADPVSNRLGNCQHIGIALIVPIDPREFRLQRWVMR
jgi:hypothetical protein